MSISIPSKQIYLSSDDANIKFNGNTSDCVWYFKDIIQVGEHLDIIMSINDVQIPMSYYIINSNNNTLNYNDGSDRSVTITEGNYDVLQLRDTLNASILKTTSNITVTYDEKTNKLTFTADSGDFTFKSSSTCFDLLGFSSGTHTSSSSVLSSDIVVNLSGISAIFIASNFSTRNLDSRNAGFTSIIGKIPVNTASNGILTYTNKTQFKSIITEKTISVIHLTLEDEDRNIINLNGVGWIITLTAEFRYAAPLKRNHLSKPMQTKMFYDSKRLLEQERQERESRKKQAVKKFKQTYPSKK